MKKVRLNMGVLLLGLMWQGGISTTEFSRRQKHSKEKRRAKV